MRTGNEMPASRSSALDWGCKSNRPGAHLKGSASRLARYDNSNHCLKRPCSNRSIRNVAIPWRARSALLQMSASRPCPVSLPVRFRRRPCNPRSGDVCLCEHQHLQHILKTRHQKRPSETGGKNGAFIAKFHTQRQSHICKMPRNRAVLSDIRLLTRSDRTRWLGRQDSNLCISESIC
jgi:hypothetical protein